jgi:hypothetical protein
MDDFTIASLQESKNEWCARLVNLLTPLMAEGFTSIFEEAYKLCESNDELDKYLMTFQNLISRIPKWNNTLVKTECERIVSRSGCDYLEDLISCVHVIQLKVLTCIRVGTKQKKIDIDIPKLEEFIHNCYIICARKVYTNVYLYELNISPLQKQKYKRELEVIIQESVLSAIRDSLPIANILRNYMDETTEEEVIQEVKEERIEQETKTDDEEMVQKHSGQLKEGGEITSSDNKKDINDKPNIQFNDVDKHVDENNVENTVDAPKDINTLEEKQRMNNMNNYDDDDDDDDDDEYEPLPKIKIHSDNNMPLNDMDVHDVSKKLSIEPDVILNDIEILG